MYSMSLLFKKELQRYRTLWIISIVIQFIAAGTVSIAKHDTASKLYLLFDKGNIDSLSDIVIPGIFFVIPMLMIYSWYREESEYTAYQALSYPVNPATIIKNKCKAFFIFGMVWITVYHILFHQLGRTIFTPRDSVYAYIMALMPYIGSILYLLLVLGFSTFLIGLGQGIRRYRILTGMFITFAVIWVTAWVRFQLGPYFNYTDSITLAAIIEHPENIMFYTTLCLEIIFPTSIGLALGYLGLFLFNRFSEV